MSCPTGGRNSKAPTPEHPTPCVASKLCPTRADWIITHRNIQRHGDDPKLYTRSFHTPEHPTPHMESVSHAGTSNAASETSNWGRTRKKEEKPYLNHRVWAAKVAARRRASPGSNQSSSRPEFVVSDGENGIGLIGTSRRIDRDSSVSALDICLTSFGDTRTVSARIADQADYGLLNPARNCGSG
ncbi:hypothetical protein L3X38_002749 [Prunus dulcis]|uniref:Uncharacterized protein n=1 Tax=Prunus dulcis TaxID=3755 RepID=A0AAD4WV22_PRUDU|nr:hypothetical protein L3X38_002749 [Prunus dulcis]